MKYRSIIGGVLAYILLALYSGIAGYIAYQVVKIANSPGEEQDVSTTQGMIYILTTVGGLVSALVVSKLTITKPGDNPAAFDEVRKWNRGQRFTVQFVVWFYLVVWMVIGLAALVIGVILYPDISETLSDLGTTWLGIAVAAGYTYLGLDPRKQGQQGQ
jgi:hypothetical protein